MGVSLCSGIFGSIITYYLNYRKEQEKYLREKAEQLFESLDHFSMGIKLHVIELVEKLKGKTHAKPSESEKDDGLAASYRTMKMISSIYFPELRSHVDVVLTCRDRINSSFDAARKDAKRKPDFVLAAKDFEDSVDTLIQKIVTTGRRPNIDALVRMWPFGGR